MKPALKRSAQLGQGNNHLTPFPPILLQYDAGPSAVSNAISLPSQGNGVFSIIYLP